MNGQPELPCSDQELVDAIEAANAARLVMEEAAAAYQVAVTRRTAALRSRGVMPA